jgi:hypothetical protein
MRDAPREAMAEQQPPDVARIFAALDAHRVDYVVVGGIAVQVHGHVRMTNDLDLIPSPTPENLKRLAAALRELQARVLNPGSEHLAIDARMLPRATYGNSAPPTATSTSCKKPRAQRPSPSCAAVL